MKKKKKNKKKEDKKKEEIFIPNFSLLLALILFLLGAFPAFGYRSLVKNCTYETKGIVVSEESGRTNLHNTVVGEYLSPPSKPVHSIGHSIKHWIKIEVETNYIFKHEYLYADTVYGNIGDEIIIRYNPDDPDEYYFFVDYNSYKSTSIILFFISGSLIVLSLFLFIYYNIPLLFPKKK